MVPSHKKYEDPTPLPCPDMACRPGLVAASQTKSRGCHSTRFGGLPMVALVVK
jgi:hypothetical protein